MIRCLVATCAIALITAAHAQPAPTPAAAPGYTMPQTAVWDMTADSGVAYRIFVSFPEGKPPAEGWPVLYVLDGNASFAGFAETRRVQEWSDVGKSIIVGVGYPIDGAYSPQRADDYTAQHPGTRDKFLDFLTGKLRAEVGRRYRINPDRQALFGHSYGGLFALHLLFSRPEAFHAIIAASPSLFYEQQPMLKAERDFAARLQAGKVPKVSRLMVVVGEREETILERTDPEAFVERIKPLSAYGLRVKSETYAGEGHMTVTSRAVSETLRFAFSWP